MNEAGELFEVPSAVFFEATLAAVLDAFDSCIAELERLAQRQTLATDQARCTTRAVGTAWIAAE